MNKKILFYFLTALIVLTFKTDSSYSAPTISNDGHIRAPEKLKKAKPRNVGFNTINGVRTKRSATDSSDHKISIPPSARKFVITNNTVIAAANVDQVQNIPIGKLIIQDVGHCTASVINTDNGNIGVTAAHCLFDQDTGQYYENIRFSPGFDNGQDGPLGQINVAQAVVTPEFQHNHDDSFDWGMIRFDFNRDGHPLQYFTGSLGYRFEMGDNVPTTIRGYPDGGNLPNCPNDGNTLCTWQGVVNLEEVEPGEEPGFYVIPNLELGSGASGAPYMWNWDPNTNLGWLYSNYISYDELNERAEAPIYDRIEFQALIGDLTL